MLPGHYRHSSQHHIEVVATLQIYLQLPTGIQRLHKFSSRGKKQVRETAVHHQETFRAATALPDAASFTIASQRLQRSGDIAALLDKRSVSAYHRPPVLCHFPSEPCQFARGGMEDVSWQCLARRKRQLAALDFRACTV